MKEARKQKRSLGGAVEDMGGAPGARPFECELWDAGALPEDKGWQRPPAFPRAISR